MDDISLNSPYSGSTRIVMGIRASDLQIFEELYRTHFEDLCRYVATVVRDEDAVDVVQDVFLSVWDMRQDIPVSTDQELLYYLLRASRNRALKIVRHDRVRDAHDRTIETDMTSGILGVGPSEETAFQELVPKVTRLVNELPPRSREVLMLRWYHGLGFKEIAVLMGISYGSVHVLHTRAMAIMRERLGVS